MLKFVVLSFLALGYVSAVSRDENFGYGGGYSMGGGYHGLGGGFRNFMGGYGGNFGYYGGKEGVVSGGKYTGGFGGFSGFGGRGGLVGGQTKYYGPGYGYSHGYGLGGGLGSNLGGYYYYYMPQYRGASLLAGGHQPTYQIIAGQQYIPQTYGINMIQGGGNAGMFTSRNVHLDKTIVSKPHVSFLTQHHSEPHQEVVQAAVTQLGRTVEYKSMPYQEQPMQAQIVEVEPSETPLHIHFKTKSSSVSLSQSHQQAPAQEAQISQTQDEPARLIHEIQKPVIQEVREVITPYRQVTQEINPVVEAVHTVVTKAEGHRQQYVANTQYQPTTYTTNMEHRQVVAQPVVAKQSTAVVAAPIATTATVAAVEPVSTVAVAPVAPAVSSVVTGVAPVVYTTGYQGAIAQPIVGGSYSTYGYGSTPMVTGATIPISTYNYEPTTTLVRSSEYIEPISTSTSSVITKPLVSTTSYTTGYSGVTGSSSSIRDVPESRVY